MRKFTAYLLIAAVLVSISACDGDVNSNNVEETSANTAFSETESLYLDALEDTSFDNSTVNLLVRTARLAELYSEEASGDVLSQALYRRDTMVEERFKVNIEYTNIADGQALWNSLINQDVMGNVGAYDIVMPDYWYGCETHFQFIDLHDYDHIFDFNAPWWCQSWNDNAEIGDQLYTAAGSMNLETIRNTLCIYVNSTLAEELKLPNMFELVYDHKWTLDKFNEFSNLALDDASGDGKYDITAGDRLGAFLGRLQSDFWWVNFGIDFASLNEDGEWTLDNFMSERTVDIYDKCMELFKSDAFVFGTSMNEEDYTINTASADAQSAFMNNTLLFFGGQVRSTERFRDMSGDYSIIPFPLYDEEQEDYRSGNIGVCYFALPVSVKNPEMSATILEALNAESYRSVVPAYYEIALKEKYTRDFGETAEMLDFITERVHFDFAMVNHASLNRLKSFLGDALYAGNEGIASAWESNKPVYNQHLANLLEAHAEYANK